jgi:hypothetical protein
VIQIEVSAPAPQTPTAQQVPSCVGLFFSESLTNFLHNIVPFPPSVAGAAGEAAGGCVTATGINRALTYAASRPNYLSGQGLIYMLKSRTYMGMLKSAVGTGAAVTVLVTADVSMAQALWTEWNAAKAGACQ